MLGQRREPVLIESIVSDQTPEESYSFVAPASLGRPHEKQQEIMDAFCRKIRCGEFSPEEELPGRKQYEEEFSTSKLTVHRAFTRLQSTGHVTTLPRKGTYVTKRPPNLFRYAIVYPFGREEFRGVDISLEKSAQIVGKKFGIEFEIFTGINNSWSIHRQETEALLDGINTHQFAGIIFATTPYKLGGLGVLEQVRTPMIVIEGDYAALNIPGIFPSGKGVENKLIAELKAQGCKRIGLISSNRNHKGVVPFFTKSLKAHGLTPHPELFQWVPALESHWEPHLVSLLFKHDPPDGLIIQDDTLSPCILRALKKEGIKVGEDVLVGEFSNFPLPHDHGVPLYNVGGNVVEALTTAIESLDLLAKGTKVSNRTIGEPLDRDRFDAFLAAYKAK